MALTTFGTSIPAITAINAAAAKNTESFNDIHLFMYISKSIKDISFLGKGL